MILAGSAVPSTAGVDFSDYEEQLMELVNQARWDNGQLPPLKANQDLTDAARYHSGDMRDDDYTDHDSYNRVDGELVFECTWVERVERYYSNRTWLGENIAWGQSTPSGAMGWWMGSPGHRSSILSTNFREIGLGYAAGGSKGHYWTQDFGARSNVYPVVINREAHSTSTPTVSLYVYGPSWAAQMRFSNDGADWSAWEGYCSHRTWELSPGGGVKIVHAEVSDGGGMVVSASDDIVYEETWLVYLPAVATNL
jgi:uncharacterized protein YkwD